MPRFLKPTDPAAFLDFPEMQQPAEHHPDWTVKCPNCKGHGGWNLQPFAYPLGKNREDTPENRHKYRHFKAGCNQCYGWGWVAPDNADHIHEWDAGVRVGNCLHKYTCKLCGKEDVVDSSD